MADASHFIDLARLSQESFEARRRYEWRINFSLWGGLGAVGYWASKECIMIFDARWMAYAVGAVLCVLYMLSLILINYGHRQDKEWKHYYMKRALGGDNIPEPGKPRFITRSQILWCVAQVAFMLVIICLVMHVLLGVKPGT